LKIKNNTNWRTDHLRAIITRVIREEFLPAKRKHVFIKIEYGKGGRYANRDGMCGGYAWYNSTNMVIKVAQDQIDAVDFAHTVAHESAHCRGLKHRDMKGKPDYMRCGNWRERYAWAAEILIEVKAIKSQTKPNAQLLRFQQTVAGIERWETKLKRATNALKKLRTRKRYYVNALAAKGMEVDQ